MQWPDPSVPLTYDDALRIAQDLAPDPGSLRHYPHHELETAEYGSGFVFLDTVPTDLGPTDGYVLVTTTRRGGGLLSAAGYTIDTVIAEHLADAAHANRDIPDSELTAAHRLALEAYDAGRTRIDDSPGRATVDAETADYAEYVLLALRHNSKQGGTGRKILAHNDSLLQPPDPRRRYTQPCPHCGQPSVYEPRYPQAVCVPCKNRTTDRTGRQITGFNTSFGGGMIAYYTDTLTPGSQQEECAEVTRTGACFINGHPATMREARFGGIVVELGSAG
ncbi:hypothetical protein [Nocardia sp. NPDC051832]|uniref:hypothetical protein n=1 Tax=Nocardia sp. NPDC051832 TaxID=3155673 RepID=UPI0034266CE4